MITEKYHYHFLFASMYLTGLIGLNLAVTKPAFELFTPFHLLATCAVLIYLQVEKNTAFWLFVGLSFGIGYGIEILGVNTGLIFGTYQYETTLGFKILKTPPMIGALWFQLSCCIGHAVDYLSNNKFIKILLGAIGMTALDFVVEPVAIKFNMWSWHEVVPPLQNYVGWFVVSLFIFWIFFTLPFKKDNKIAVWILLLTCVFFLGNRILL